MDVDPIANRTLSPAIGRRPAGACVALLGALLSLSSPLSAQGVANRGETDGPSFKLGETDLYPSLRVDTLRVDNAYRTPDNEQAANVVVVSPRVLWLAQRRQLTLSGSYDGEYARSGESVLEHDDHALSLGVEAAVDKRLSGGASIVYRRDHYDRGDNFARNTDIVYREPVVFDELRLIANGRYGARRARGNIGFGLRAYDRHYANLEALTSGLDYTLVEPYLRFSVRIAGDTRAFVEGRSGTVNFGTGRRDRQDLSLLGGVSFAATQRTFGEFLLGVTRSSFDDATRGDDSNLVAEGNLRYEPRDYSRVSASLRRVIDNTADSTVAGGVAAVSTDLRLEWDYDWSERVSQSLFAAFENLERDCPDPSRQSVNGGLELALSVRRWLELGGSVGASRRVGDGCGTTAQADEAARLDYDLVSFGLFARARL